MRLGNGLRLGVIVRAANFNESDPPSAGRWATIPFESATPHVAAFCFNTLSGSMGYDTGHYFQQPKVIFDLITKLYPT